jgi:S1-C subfamily serine protease
MSNLLRPLAFGLAACTLALGAACSPRTEEPPEPTITPDVTTVSVSATETPPPSPTPTATAAIVRPGNELSVVDLVRMAEPSIVRIQTPSGVGTGFIVDADGHIITNNHVVVGTGTRPAASIEVTLSDGAKKPARVVGTDPRGDLALLRIDGAGYKPLVIGKLEDVQVGQDVVAIGYALDLRRGEGPSYSVTRGIVSAKNRGIDESSTILGAIQTDAAINHGNSGGPLLSMYGEVVGVNTALAPDRVSGGVAIGIGFAVGADTVRAVYEELKESGSVNRGVLGIQFFEALRPARAQQIGLPADTKGVYLNERGVVAGGAADLAGIRPGDVISRLGSYVLRNESDLAVALIRLGGGERVEVEYWREGRKTTVTLTLGSTVD